MTIKPEWWRQPRQITVVVDNNSWILPYAERLVREISNGGDEVRLARTYEEIVPSTVAFYLGCVRITPPDILALNRRNLVVHASDLPKGRGFSPMTWLILEGCNEIPVCLLEAAQQVDAGAVIYRDIMALRGYELNEEIRVKLGGMHIDLCMRFLAESLPLEGIPQQGESTCYPRRRPKDSRLDPEKTLADQFNLLRVVDNERYPAFFDYRGKRYKLAIEYMSEDLS